MLQYQCNVKNTTTIINKEKLVHKQLLNLLDIDRTGGHKRHTYNVFNIMMPTLITFTKNSNSNADITKF